MSLYHCADFCAEKLIQHTNIPSSHKPVFRYGIELTISTLSSILSVLFLSLLLNATNDRNYCVPDSIYELAYLERRISRKDIRAVFSQHQSYLFGGLCYFQNTSYSGERVASSYFALCSQHRNLYLGTCKKQESSSLREKIPTK